MAAKKKTLNTKRLSILLTAEELKDLRHIAAELDKKHTVLARHYIADCIRRDK